MLHKIQRDKLLQVFYVLKMLLTKIVISKVAIVVSKKTSQKASNDIENKSYKQNYMAHGIWTHGTFLKKLSPQV